jgi:serine/threonine protein kinase
VHVAPGQKIGPYRVLSPMMESELGQLYVAKRPGIAGPGGRVTVLVLHPHLAAEPRFVEPLLADVLLATRVRHPNVAAAEEVGQDHGTYFVVADFVEGVSLRRLVGVLRRRGRRLRPPLAVHVAMAVADGLHAAHEVSDGSGLRLGLLHGDLSADRILLSYKGEVRVAGFGVARALRVALAAGSRPASEGASGEDAPPDARDDLRAVGRALWEMLTAEPEVDPAEREALRAWLREPSEACPIDGLAPAHDKLVRWLVDLVDPEAGVPMADAWQLRQGLGRFCPEVERVTRAELGELLATALEEDDEPPWNKVPEVRAGDVRRRAPARPDALERLTRIAGAPLEVVAPRERAAPQPEPPEADWLELKPPPPIERERTSPARLLAWVVLAGIVLAAALLGASP